MAVIWHSDISTYNGPAITDTDTIYFTSRGAKEGFLNKTIHTEYSAIRESAISKNGYNASCIHLNLPFSETLDISVIGWCNKPADGSSAMLDNRWHYGRVIDREYVNPTSTRIHFVLDYWLSYMDLIEFGQSFTKRHHMQKGLDTQGGYYNYRLCGLLPEPIEAAVGLYPYTQGGVFKVAPFNNYDWYTLAATDQYGGSAITTYVQPDGSQFGNSPDGAFGFVYRGSSAMDIGNILHAYVLNRVNELKFDDTSNVKDIFSINATPYFPTEVGSVNLPSISKVQELTGVSNIYNGKTVSSLFCKGKIVGCDGSIISLDEFDTIGTTTGTVYYQNYLSDTETPHANLVINSNGQVGNLTKSFSVPCPTFSFSSDAFTDAKNASFMNTVASVTGGGVKIVGGVAQSAIGVAGAARGGGDAISGAGSGIGEIVAGVSNNVEAMISVAGWALGESTRVGTSSPKSKWKIATREYNGALATYFLELPTQRDIKAIDNYFTYYGYNISQMFTPNPGLRDKVTYIQCEPAFKKAPSNQYYSQFVNQLRNGVRFWKNGLIGEDPGEN